ncbi:glycoside hydrolase family 13 protein, partial [Ideonella sp.]|uniref:glycoside hydrolase family 13 protein n=1 Tax=Ideonella sp. TaxID=1929293 RepID=UPI003BB6257C
ALSACGQTAPLRTGAVAAAPASACAPSPLGDNSLYLRGSMNGWAAQDDFEFLWRCDAWWLNVTLTGAHEFKIGDAAWSDGANFGAAPGMGGLALAGGASTGGVRHTFDGQPRSLRLTPGVADQAPVLSMLPPSFTDPRVAPVTEALPLSLRFDSRSTQHKSPYGAQPAGSTVQFSLQAAPGLQSLTLVIESRTLEGNQDVLSYAPLARVPLQRSADGTRWEGRYTFSQPAVYGYWFEAQAGEQRWAYQNNRDMIHWTRERGSGGLGQVERLAGDSAADLRRIRRFRQTIHAADFKVPAWSHEAVYYYIFPERFRNGDRRNDPQPGRDTYQDQAVERHSNWLDHPWKPAGPGEKGDGSDAVYNNDFFGGDIAGIIEKLDDIAELGANTLYITPLFKAASNHKYDTADYLTIDPGFGSNADFDRLTAEAAKRGLRVIPDTSLNHVGLDSPYFDRFGKYPGLGAFEGGKIQPASPWASWFKFDPSQTDPDKQYTGWVGVKDLPELNKSSPALRDFFYRRPDSVMKHWLDHGAAGWRMDVAPWVPDDFWREWRAAIKTHKPDALTIAETWFDASKFFLGDSFDSTMNYIFRNALLDYAKGGDAGPLVSNLELMREAYPPQAFHALMNLLSSHDQARSLHVFGWTEGADAAAIALAKQRMKLAWTFQMGYPGAPAIYYGDEVGVTGGDDPFNRATYPWADLGGQPDLALRAELKQLLAARKANPVLSRGSLMAPLLAEGKTLVLARQLGTVWAVTASHSGAEARTVSVRLPAGAPAQFRNALTGERLSADNGQLQLSLPALGGLWLVSP